MEKGLLSRVVDEVRYWTQPSWPLADVEEHYDDLASHYDEINEAADSHFRRFTDALRLAHLPDHARVLEIFARTGEGITFFYQHGKVGSGVCVDVSRKMGGICKQRLQDIDLEDVIWIQMTDYPLPLDDESFDVVFCLETIEHVSQPARLVSELSRVTRPHGTMVLSTPNVLWEPIHALAAITGLHHSEGPHRFIRYKRLLKIVQEAGFRVEQAETNVLIPAGPKWMIQLGERLETLVKHSLMPWIGLRRMLICRKLA